MSRPQRTPACVTGTISGQLAHDVLPGWFMTPPVRDERAMIRPIPMVSVEAGPERHTPTAGQIDSQVPDPAPHGFTTDADRPRSIPPKRRWRALGHGEIVAWTVAALTAGTLAATITITAIAASPDDVVRPATGAAANAAPPAPLEKVALGARQAPEPASAATAIPLAALPKADPPKTTKPARSTITATKATARTKATTTKKKAVSPTKPAVAKSGTTPRHATDAHRAAPVSR